MDTSQHISSAHWRRGIFQRSNRHQRALHGNSVTLFVYCDHVGEMSTAATTKSGYLYDGLYSSSTYKHYFIILLKYTFFGFGTNKKLPGILQLSSTVCCSHSSLLIGQNTAKDAMLAGNATANHCYYCTVPQCMRSRRKGVSCPPKTQCAVMSQNSVHPSFLTYVRTDKKKHELDVDVICYKSYPRRSCHHTF